jgi:uncharacterized cupin superfamily protein
MGGIYSEEWQNEVAHGSFGLRWTHIGKQLGTAEVGITLYELDPGKHHLPYHAHFGIEEVVVVLKGTPTLRGVVGERQLAEGEVVAFPRGRAGAHQLINRSDAVTRFLMLSSMSSADLIEYPDSGTILARSGQGDGPDDVSYRLRMEPQVSFLELAAQ